MNIYWFVPAGVAYVASSFVLGLFKSFSRDEDIYKTLTCRLSLRDRVWVIVENLRYR